MRSPAGAFRSNPGGWAGVANGLNLNSTGVPQWVDGSFLGPADHPQAACRGPNCTATPPESSLTYQTALSNRQNYSSAAC